MTKSALSAGRHATGGASAPAVPGRQQAVACRPAGAGGGGACGAQRSALSTTPA